MIKPSILAIVITTIFSIIFIRAHAQQCLSSGGCTTFTSQYPSSGAPYTPPSTWQVLTNPTNGTPALMNAGNYTLFNVIAGNTYEWTYCETYGGVSTSWDAQLTLFNNANITVPLCFSTDVCGNNGNAPYISWTATFTGTVRILSTLYSGGFGCKSNVGTALYNKLAYRQLSGISCITPGSPASASATSTGQTSASLSWSPGDPVVNSVVTYYWVVGTSPTVTYGNGVAQGSTTGTSASTSALTCGNTYYLRVYSSTNCNGANSDYKTSTSFTTGSCSNSSILGIDIYQQQQALSWPQLSSANKTFAYVKATKGMCYTDSKFFDYMKDGKNAAVLGAYHFALPEDNPNATDEANYFLNVAGPYIGPGYLPPALDLEDPSGTCIVNNKPLTTYYSGNTLALAQWVHDWATTVSNKTHVMPILYVDRCRAGLLYPYYVSGLIQCQLWIADYDNPAGSPKNYPKCDPWVGWPWVFHQYSESGNVLGINPVDLDIFNGDKTAFNSLINNSSTTTYPDLTITANTQTISPTNISAGGSITVSCSEDNSGTVPAGANDVTVWLSSDATLNTNADTYLGKISFPSLPANSNSLVYNNTIQIPAGTTAGNYYVFFWADGNQVVTESNETNNFASKTITVTAPVTLPDLIVQNAQITPSSVSMGLQVTASCTNKNQGTGNAGASVTSLWLSADQTFDSSIDTYIGEIPVPALNAGTGSSTLSKQINIPLGPYAGTWYIMFGADGSGSVAEGNESNNQVFVPISFNASTCTPLTNPINPTDQTVSLSGSATFSCGVNGTLPVYQWQVSTDNGNSWNNVTASGPYSNATTSSLSISPASASMNGYKYRCQLSNSCTTPFNTNAATLTVSSSGCISSIPPSSITQSIATTPNGPTIELKIVGGSLAADATWRCYADNCGGTLVASGHANSFLVYPTTTTKYYIRGEGCVNTTCTSITVNPITQSTITSFTPTTAATGNTVTITGTNLGNASAVTFGSVPASSFVVVSPTTITAVVGSGSSGNISVTTPSGVTSLAGFTFFNFTFNPLTSHVYGSSDFTPDFVSALPVTFSSTNTNVASIVSGKIHITGVGATTISATDGNTTLTQQLTVTTAPLTITADNKTKPYGQPNSVLTFSTTGFVNGDDITKLITKPLITTTATDNSPIGVYPITVSGATSPNYNISFLPGTLTVTFATQTINFAAISDKIVGNADFTLTASSTSGLPVSFQSGDNTIATIVNGNQVHILKAGTVTITASQSGSSNYYAAPNVSRTFTILPVPTISANGPVTFFTGGSVVLTANTGAGYTYVWSKNGTDVSGSSSATYTAYESGSYSISIISGTLRVTSAPIIVKNIFNLPSTNFKLTITGAACKGSNNGSVSIIASQPLNYTATITGNGLNAPYFFTNTKTIENLSAGTYSICITLADQPAYQKCFNAVITEPKDLSLYTTVNTETNSIFLALGGSTQYNISLNGIQYSTKEQSITLQLKPGDNHLMVSTDKLCQGVIEKHVTISSHAIPYPNPFQNTLNVYLGSEELSNIQIEIFDLKDGSRVYSGKFGTASGTLKLDVGRLGNGVYSLRLSSSNNADRIFKILKQ